jgi:hypothetical protein
MTARRSGCGRPCDHAVRHHAWIGDVGDSQSGSLSDVADHHFDGILVGLEDMRRGRVWGNTGGRDRGRFDIDTVGRYRVNELTARAGSELDHGCCRGAGERQAGLQRCAGA